MFKDDMCCSNCNMYSAIVLCCFVLCSQRGSSRVYLHDVSVMQLR
jgi:hypothetical protein